MMLIVVLFYTDGPSDSSLLIFSGPVTTWNMLQLDYKAVQTEERDPTAVSGHSVSPDWNRCCFLKTTRLMIWPLIFKNRAKLCYKCWTMHLATVSIESGLWGSPGDFLLAVCPGLALLNIMDQTCCMDPDFLGPTSDFSRLCYFSCFPHHWSGIPEMRMSTSSLYHHIHPGCYGLCGSGLLFSSSCPPDLCTDISRAARRNLRLHHIICNCSNHVPVQNLLLLNCVSSSAGLCQCWRAENNLLFNWVLTSNAPLFFFLLEIYRFRFLRSLWPQKHNYTVK